MDFKKFIRLHEIFLDTASCMVYSFVNKSYPWYFWYLPGKINKSNAFLQCSPETQVDNYSKMHHHIPHGGFGCERHLQEKDKTSLMTHAFSKINMITLSNQRFLFTLEMMMKCLSTSFTRIKSHENLVFLLTKDIAAYFR